MITQFVLSTNLGIFRQKKIYLVVFFCLVLVINLCATVSIHDVSAQGPCGDTYIVLVGDTIEGIAELCGTTVQAILSINPEIDDPENLYPGQIIRIPEVESVLESIVAISPTCGLPGSSLLVVGSGFPQNSTVQIGIGQKESEPTRIGETPSDQFGRIDTSVILPSSAPPGTTWVVTAETQVSNARFVGVSNSYSVIPKAQNPNAGTTYIVQQGDTLRSIAAKFNRDLDAVLNANPQLTAANPLVPGESIVIPPQDPETPTTTVRPICGPVESQIQVNGTGFPPSTTINLHTGEYLVSYEQVGTAFSSPIRTFQTQLTIPVTAQVGEQWVVLSETSSNPNMRSTSNIFIITPPFDPAEPSLYITKPGDTLNAIAAQYTRTVASILAVNPQITNPNQLEIGEKIIIPGQKETIIITPVSGVPLTTIQVGGLGYQPFSSVTLGLARDTVIFSIEGSVNTDVNGFFSTNFIIPPSAQVGELWTVVSIKSDEKGGEVTARSNEFTVTRPQPVLQPILTIWPLAGSPGSHLSVVGSNYNSMSLVRYSFGVEGQAPYMTSTVWTEINGTFAVDLFLPANAESGESWIVTAELDENPLVSATSPEFFVSNP
ncbi:MAG: LysM peptidoglycan-binding domain-containing protein [Anaerolineales bacterium]